MMNNKKITVGCDHAGFGLKKIVIAHLQERGFEVLDVGTHSTDSCDYPKIAHELCKNIQNGTTELGILICGTGIGMSMAANKHRGIRAAACSDTFSARFTRLHNDANVLCMGERVLGPGLACDIADIFLATEFEGGRHKTRVDLIMALEDKLSK